MIQPIFKDPALQKSFEQDGYLKVHLLEKEDVSKLKELFYQLFPGDISRFFSSSYLNDYEKKMEISTRLQQIIVPRLDRYFNDYRSFGSSYLVKGMGKSSEMPMHQDWTIVDENKYSAINIWTPLIYTDEHNGTLELLKGSHNWNKTIRAPTLPFYFEAYKTKIMDKLTSVKTRPGEAILINQATIHYSKPNLSDELRIAITTGITSAEAPLSLYYWNKDKPDQIECFQQKDDFLLNFTDFHKAIFERPLMGQSLGLEPFCPPPISDKEVDEFLEKLPSRKGSLRKGFIKLLLEKFR